MRLCLTLPNVLEHCSLCALALVLLACWLCHVKIVWRAKLCPDWLASSVITNSCHEGACYITSGLACQKKSFTFDPFSDECLVCFFPLLLEISQVPLNAAEWILYRSIGYLDFLSSFWNGVCVIVLEMKTSFQNGIFPKWDPIVKLLFLDNLIATNICGYHNNHLWHKLNNDNFINYYRCFIQFRGSIGNE